MDPLARHPSGGAIEMSRQESRGSNQPRAESSDEVEDGGVLVKNEQPAWNWDSDAKNPYNWPSGKKAWQVAMISTSAFLA